ncbi:MAG: head decoration protein [Burkholderiales bacterium]|nr:head decoration protein [Burkholderiales bacterium]
MTTMAKELTSVVLYEEELAFSRDTLTLKSGNSVAIGTVLGIITASGKVVAYAPGASDGSQNAACVALETVDATAADKPIQVLARHGIVGKDGLAWGAAVTTQNHKDTAYAALKALGILARTSV